MPHAKNTDYLNWATLFCLLIASSVKGVIDSHVKENKASGPDHIIDLIHPPNHTLKDYSGEQNSYSQSDIEFQTQIIPYEYIVKFSGFYKAENRQNYIDASLAKFDLKTKDDSHVRYRIIKRQNIMAKYPSDFDLVEFYMSDFDDNKTASVIETLTSHPLIKSVTPQQKVTRSIRSINKEKDPEETFSATPSNSESSPKDENPQQRASGQVPTFIDRLMHPNSSLGCGDVEQEIDSPQSDTNSWIRGRRSLTYGHSYRYTNRRLLKAMPRQITATLQADILWQMGVTGAGVKVAIFDTGLSKTHPHFKKIRERTNWTNEKTLNDELGHGTFVAGVIASSKECLGFAPDAEIHVFRVFTKNQVSYTSWFLDAFNYAIMKKIHVLNLSIGGPDFKDTPFVEKVRAYEITFTFHDNLKHVTPVTKIIGIYILGLGAYCKWRDNDLCYWE